MLKTIPNTWLFQLLLLASFFFGIPASDAAFLKNMPSGAKNYFLTDLSPAKSPKHEDSCRISRQNPGNSSSVLTVFIQEDPRRDGLNWYGYVGGDPVNYADPSGYFQNDIFMRGVGVDGLGGGGPLSNSAISSLPPISDSHAQFLGGLAGFTGGLITGAVGGSIVGPLSLGMSEAALLAPLAPILVNSLANQWADFQNSNITEKAFVVGSLIGGCGVGTITKSNFSGTSDELLKVIAKDGTAITGFTKHGINRVIGDNAKRAGTNPSAILDAIKNPLKIQQGLDLQQRPYKRYIGKDARVVINPETGRVISINPLSNRGRLKQ